MILWLNLLLVISTRLPIFLSTGELITGRTRVNFKSLSPEDTLLVEVATERELNCIKKFNVFEPKTHAELKDMGATMRPLRLKSIHEWKSHGETGKRVCKARLFVKGLKKLDDRVGVDSFACS